MIDVERFIDGYIECALWADCMPASDDPNAESGGGEHLELRNGAREKMAADCRTFCEENADDLARYCEQRGFDASYAGHDFWLTRQHHGAGFWDRGLGALGQRLTEAAHAYGSADDHTPFDCGDGTADA